MINFRLCKTILIIISLSSHGMINASAQLKTFKVTDYGANPNDKHDDTQSIQNCINDALRSTENVTILFPKPKNASLGYKISNSLKIEPKRNHSISIIGNKNSNSTIFMCGDASRYPIYCAFYIRSEQEYNGSILVQGINIEGAFSKGLQQYIDKPNGAKGLFLINIRKASISHNTFKNIYGDGIWCNGSNLNDTTDKIIIENNKFTNVFGLNLTADKYSGGENYDNYGDGISITDLQNVVIRNNQIINNLVETKSFGRAGIVLEKNATNCTISNNFIAGYDRAIHIEGDKGGHKIIGNTTSGTNMAVFIYSVKHSNRNPIQIRNNQFQYNNECKKYKLAHLHASYPVFILIDGAQSEHLVGTVIQNNTFSYNQPISPKKIVNDFLYIPKQGGVSWCGNSYFSGKTKLNIDNDCK